MVNLLDETKEILARFHKTPEEILWIGDFGGQFSCTWQDFTRIAAKIVYNDDYGTSFIPSDLVIVGKDWWLERDEYDGAEWWNFKTVPQLSEKPKKFVSLKKEVWGTYRIEGV